MRNPRDNRVSTDIVFSGTRGIIWPRNLGAMKPFAPVLSPEVQSGGKEIIRSRAKPRQFEIIETAKGEFGFFLGHAGHPALSHSAE